jgi:hypothetical protein
MADELQGCARLTGAVVSDKGDSIQSTEIADNRKGKPTTIHVGQKAPDFTPVSDIDNAEDLAHALSLARSHAYVSRFQQAVMAPKRFLAWVDKTGVVVSTPPNLDHDPREGTDA